MWAEDTVTQYRQKCDDPSEPFPPRMDGDLLMEMPANGLDALERLGYALDPKAVYLNPRPHYAVGIVKLVVD